MNGFLNILKPPGMSSAAVVATVKRLTGEKRIGHAGTLDPEAAGVLPIMLGQATRLFDYLSDKEKCYIAECAFGAETEDLPLMQAVAAVLEAEPESFRAELRGALDKGLPHPAAVARAAGSLIPGAAELLRRPNNTLGVCYLRALQRLNSPMKPILVPDLAIVDDATRRMAFRVVRSLEEIQQALPELLG